MGTARDRAAEALCKASPPALDLPWADLPSAEREPYYEAADAVLAVVNYQGAVDEIQQAHAKLDDYGVPRYDDDERPIRLVLRIAVLVDTLGGQSGGGQLPQIGDPDPGIRADE
jgi:hypothetical protein